MIILMIIGYLSAAQSELTTRCQRYGINLNDCLNSTYLPKKEYDEYLQSFNMPIVRDASCTKGRCVAFVYKDPNKCTGCAGGDCGNDCIGANDVRENPALSREVAKIESRLRREMRMENSILRDREVEPQRSLVHVIHHQDRSGDISRKVEPLVSYKSLTVVETKTETVSDCSTASVTKEDNQKTKTLEPSKEEIKTLFKTIEITRTHELPEEIRTKTVRVTRIPKLPGSNRKGYSERSDQAACDEDFERASSADKKMIDESIPTAVRRPKSNRCVPGFSGDDTDKCTSAADEASGGVEPEVTTVTRVFYKTISVEKPITLYREVTTTVKNEVPIINYKITTVKEVSTYTKTENKPTTETVVQTQYSVSVSTKTQTVQAESVAPQASVSVSTEKMSKDEDSTKSKDSKKPDIPEAPATKVKPPSTKESPDVVYKTVMEPTTLVLTVTKTQEKTVVQPEIISAVSPQPTATKKEIPGAKNQVEPGVASVVCTENCSTITGPREAPKSVEEKLSILTKYITETKILDRISTSVAEPSLSSILNTFAKPAKSIGTPSPKQDVTAELIPLIRDILLESTKDATAAKPSKRKAKMREMREPARTVIKTITTTVKEDGKDIDGHKTVYNTVYSYRKRPRCKIRGVEGKEKKQCHDSEDGEVTTTVYV